MHISTNLPLAAAGGQGRPGGATFDAQRRLEFLRLDGDARAALRDAWRLVEPRLAGIVSDFYDHLAGQPELSRLLDDGSRIPRLKVTQTEHWRHLFSASFDDAYMERVTRIGRTHQRIGLEPRWYMGGYAFILDRVLGVLAEGLRWTPRNASRCMGAVVRAVTLDMDLALATYFKAMEEAQAAQLEALAQSFESDVKGAVEVVAGAAAELRATSGAMADVAAQARRQAEAVSAAAGATSANVQTVAVACEEMSASIVEIGRQTTRSAGVAQRGVAQAAETTRTVAGLADSASRIAEVARLIGQVAGQTNMLAMNATIEAARAGEAGKGFAVVAAEVKALAGQTAQATEAISTQAQAIHAVTSAAMAALDGMGGTIAAIGETTQAIASAVEQQGAATGEISRNVQQAAVGTEAVSRAIDHVNRAAGQCGAAAEQVLGAADELSMQAERLSQRVAAFLAAVRKG